jgi:hypothetical protein
MLSLTQFSPIVSWQRIYNSLIHTPFSLQVDFQLTTELRLNWTDDYFVFSLYCLGSDHSTKNIRCLAMYIYANHTENSLATRFYCCLQALPTTGPTYHIMIPRRVTVVIQKLIVVQPVKELSTPYRTKLIIAECINARHWHYCSLLSISV